LLFGFFTVMLFSTSTMVQTSYASPQPGDEMVVGLHIDCKSPVERTEIWISTWSNIYDIDVPGEILIIDPHGETLSLYSFMDKFDFRISLEGPFNGEYREIIDGNYTVFSHIGGLDKKSSFLVQLGKCVYDSSGEVYKIPDWFQYTAYWWSTDQVEDSEFISAIQHLMEEDILIVPVTKVADSSSDKIPEWIKNIAGWWADGKILDGEFVKSLQYLINQGTIVVDPPPISELKNKPFDVYIYGKKAGFTVSTNNVDVTSFSFPSDTHSVIIYTRVPKTLGTMEIQIDRFLLDSKSRGSDERFVVKADYTIMDYKEIQKTTSTRTLSMELPAWTEKIEIIGTERGEEWYSPEHFKIDDKFP